VVEFVLTGGPDQEWGGVRADDVALALRDLGPGFHSIADVWFSYGRVSGRSPGGGVTVIATKMGMKPFMLDGERGWRVDPERLARHWPRYPWS
jgi:hypothetical protein